jgi:hypothetical protein
MARYKIDQWKSFIAEWQKSGKTREAFCRERNLTVPTFSYWRTKLNKLGNTETDAPVKDSFVRYNLPSSVSNEITIEWPDGMKLRLPSEINLQEIGELLRSLKGDQ